MPGRGTRASLISEAPPITKAVLPRTTCAADPDGAHVHPPGFVGCTQHESDTTGRGGAAEGSRWASCAHLPGRCPLSSSPYRHSRRGLHPRHGRQGRPRPSASARGDAWLNEGHVRPAPAGTPAPAPGLRALVPGDPVHGRGRARPSRQGRLAAWAGNSTHKAPLTAANPCQILLLYRLPSLASAGGARSARCAPLEPPRARSSWPAVPHSPNARHDAASGGRERARNLDPPVCAGFIWVLMAALSCSLRGR